jgi:hypothetical protein
MWEAASAMRLSEEDLEDVRRVVDDPDADPVARARAIKYGMDHWTAMLQETVAEARRRGIPWVTIADALVVSRQAAAKRFLVRIVEEEDDVDGGA